MGSNSLYCSPLAIGSNSSLERLLYATYPLRYGLALHWLYRVIDGQRIYYSASPIVVYLTTILLRYRLSVSCTVTFNRL